MRGSISPEPIRASRLRKSQTLGSWEVGKQQGPGGRREASPGGQLPESTEGRFTPYHREPSELLAATTLPTSQLRCLYSTGAFILHQT